MTLRLHANSSEAQRASIASLLSDYGHWAIYRRYDLASKSPYIDPATNEGVDGSRWTYVDQPILIRHDPSSIRSASGTVLERSKILVEASVLPKRGDVIIEVDYNGENRDLTPGLVMQLTHREAYTIDDMDPKRGQGGALIFTVCIVVPRLEAY